MWGNCKLQIRPTGRGLLYDRHSRLNISLPQGRFDTSEAIPCRAATSLSFTNGVELIRLLSLPYDSDRLSYDQSFDKRKRSHSTSLPAGCSGSAVTVAGDALTERGAKYRRVMVCTQV